MLGQHRPASEKPLKWRFAGGSGQIIAVHLDPLCPQKRWKKALSNLDPLWQHFLDLHMDIVIDFVIAPIMWGSFVLFCDSVFCVLSSMSLVAPRRSRSQRGVVVKLHLELRGSEFDPWLLQSVRWDCHGVAPSPYYLSCWWNVKHKHSYLVEEVRESWMLFFNCILTFMFVCVLISLPQAIMRWYVTTAFPGNTHLFVCFCR